MIIENEILKSKNSMEVQIVNTNWVNPIIS